MAKPYRERVEIFGTRDGEVLMGQYPEDKTMGTFGGGIDPGEDPAEAAAREFEEESGLKLKDVRMLDAPPFEQKWKPPYKTEAQAERAKKYKGSRTRYATGEIEGEGEKGEGSDAVSNLKKVKYRKLTSVLKRMNTQLQDLPEDARQRVIARIIALELLSEKAAAEEDKYWIGVDLDATLAVYRGWKGPKHIGTPIPKMVRRVKRWLKDGKTVKIFTARVSGDNGVARRAIQKFCKKVFGQVLPITNRKDQFCKQVWDDRSHNMKANTGDQMNKVANGFTAEEMEGETPSKEAVAEFFQSNPNPTDEEFHEWAEEQGYNTHKAEQVAYELATEATEMNKVACLAGYKEAKEPRRVLQNDFDGEEAEVSFKVKGDAKRDIVEMLEHIGTIGGYGHSFEIEVDPESSDYKQTFGFDGDGADRIFDLKVDGKKAKFSKEAFVQGYLARR